MRTGLRGSSKVHSQSKPSGRWRCFGPPVCVRPDYDSRMTSSRLTDTLHALACVAAVFSGCATNADAMLSLRASAEPLLQSHPPARLVVEASCTATQGVSVTKRELGTCALTVQALVDLTSIELGPSRGETVLSRGLRLATTADAVVAARIKALNSSGDAASQSTVTSLVQLLAIADWLAAAERELLLMVRGPWPARAAFAVDVSGLVELALSTPDSEFGLALARTAQRNLVRRSQTILELTEPQPNQTQ